MNLFGAMLRMPVMSEGFQIKLGIPGLPPIREIELQPELLTPSYL